jgi:predicted DsbA family dithiol-disulfide isomerase
VSIYILLKVPCLFLTFFNSTFKGFVSQTTRAHRLCQKAYQLGGQDFQIPMLKAIYKAHMEEGQDISEIAVLADIAEDTGTMSKEKVNSVS